MLTAATPRPSSAAMARRGPRLRRLLASCVLLVAVAGGLVFWSTGAQKTSPPEQVQKAWLAASVRVAAGGDAQTITFAQPLPVTAGVPAPLSASASSGLPVSFSSDTPSVCTVSGSAAATVAVGLCTITASQAGGAGYAPAPDVTQSFQVQAPPIAQTITFAQPLPVTAGVPAPLSASASSGLPVSFTSDTPSVCTVSGSTARTVAAGTCTITASQTGNADGTVIISGTYISGYAAAPDVSRSFQVNPVSTPPVAQTITFAQPLPVTAGVPVTLSASASSGLPVSFSSGTPSVCAVSGGSTARTVAAGTCEITASQAGNARYAAAPDISRSFQANPVQKPPVAQKIVFGPPSPVAVGVPVTLSASASSGLPVSFSSDPPSVCTVTDSTARTVAAGTCTITASQAGNARYAAAPDVSRSFRVNLVASKKAGIPLILLAAVILAAAAAAAALTVRRRLRSRPPPAPSVRAVPHTGPPSLVSVQYTGTEATHSVCIKPSRGASVTTIEEARP